MNDLSNLFLGSLHNNPAEAVGSSNHSQTKILIVDDELIIAVDLAYSLEKTGYQVVGLARDGESAVQLALSTRPDIIILDIHLVGSIDGITAAERIMKKLQTRIIMASAYPEKDSRVRKLLKEIHGSFIQKPYSIEAICKKIVENVIAEYIPCQE